MCDDKHANDAPDQRPFDCGREVRKKVVQDHLAREAIPKGWKPFTLRPEDIAPSVPDSATLITVYKNRDLT